MPSSTNITRLTLLAIAVLSLTSTSATPTNVRRHGHTRRGKRDHCAIKPSASSVPSSSGTLEAMDVGATDRSSGHWQVYTTSTFIPDTTTSRAIPTTSAVSTNSSAHTDTSTLVSTTSIETGSGSTWADSNPITSFLSSSADSISLSLSLDGSNSSGASYGLPPIPTSTGSSSGPTSTAAANGKHVFAHFMVGIVSTYGSADWEADMSLAKSKGITGFALNIGTDSYTQTQLDLAYAAAAKVEFAVFISFDFNWYHISDVSGVAQMLSRYAKESAQVTVDGKPFVSTFIGDGFDWAAVAKQVGMELYAVPYWAPTQANADNAALGGLFSWDAWPGQLGNVPVCANMTSAHDELYLNALAGTNKTYMAPVSPWFSTHFGSAVSYSKNWLFYSEMLWKTRWDQILAMGSQIQFIEIVTWNDYGESHYIGPYNTPHTDDGSSKWAAGLDHSAMLDFAVPYIEAFKTGATEPVITTEMLVYWYRPTLKSASCDSTDNCGSKPTGWEFVEDSVFVAAMTTSGGSVTITSGSNAAVTHTVASGVQVFQVPMGVGEQSFRFSTTAGKSGTATANVTISSDCWNGIYNFNYHSGSIIP